MDDHKWREIKDITPTPAQLEELIDSEHLTDEQHKYIMKHASNVHKSRYVSSHMLPSFVMHDLIKDYDTHPMRLRHLVSQYLADRDMPESDLLQVMDWAKKYNISEQDQILRNIILRGDLPHSVIRKGLESPNVHTALAFLGNGDRSPDLINKFLGHHNIQSIRDHNMLRAFGAHAGRHVPEHVRNFIADAALHDGDEDVLDALPFFVAAPDHLKDLFARVNDDPKLVNSIRNSNSLSQSHWSSLSDNDLLDIYKKSPLGTDFASAKHVRYGLFFREITRRPELIKKLFESAQSQEERDDLADLAMSHLLEYQHTHVAPVLASTGAVPHEYIFHPSITPHISSFNMKHVLQTMDMDHLDTHGRDTTYRENMRKILSHPEYGEIVQKRALAVLHGQGTMHDKSSAINALDMSNFVPQTTDDMRAILDQNADTVPGFISSLPEKDMAHVCNLWKQLVLNPSTPTHIKKGYINIDNNPSEHNDPLYRLITNDDKRDVLQTHGKELHDAIHPRSLFPGIYSDYSVHDVINHPQYTTPQSFVDHKIAAKVFSEAHDGPQYMRALLLHGDDPHVSAQWGNAIAHTLTPKQCEQIIPSHMIDDIPRNASKLRDVLQDYLSNPLRHQESVKVNFSERLRQARDFIDNHGGSLHYKKLEQAGLSPKVLGIEHLRNPKTQHITSASIQDHIGTLPHTEYGVSHSTWNGAQMHSDDQRNHVFQLNMSPQIEHELKRQGLYGGFQKLLDMSKNSGHPVGDKTIGWVRYSHAHKPHETFIDEIQSDLGQSTVRQLRDMARDNPNKEQELGDLSNDIEKIHHIVWQNRHPSDVLHHAFLQSMRDAGLTDRHNVAIWHTDSKSRIALDDPDLDPPVHMKETYLHHPKKLGYKPSQYGDLSIQDNMEYSGVVPDDDDDTAGTEPYKTWMHALRKSEELYHCVFIPISACIVCSETFDIDDLLSWLLQVRSAIPGEILNEESQLHGWSPHITLLYGLHNNSDMQQVARRFANEFPPLCELAGIEYFDNPNETIAYLKINDTNGHLGDLHRILCGFAHTEKYLNYIPHITIATLKPGSRLSSAVEPPMGIQFTAQHCTWGNADNTNVLIPFKTKSDEINVTLEQAINELLQVAQKYEELQ